MDARAVMDILHRGKVLAASVPSTASSRLAWIGVYPLDASRPLTVELLRNQGIPVERAMHGPAFHVRVFEVDRRLIEQDACFAERELMNSRSYFAFGDGDLATKLRDVGLRVDQLDLPFKSGYPL
jgi:hypothetical protein